ncbi:MAG: XRE family transcriptional regulator [Vulcanimicrobiaceae bacterium]
MPAALQAAADSDSVARLSTPEVVQELERALGAPLVGLIADVSDGKKVRAWTAGRAEPHPRRAYALRSALQALRAIKMRYTDGVARAWFIGMNHHLGHHAPSELLNEIAAAAGNAYLSKPYMDRARRVLDAARIFAEVYH